MEKKQYGLLTSIAMITGIVIGSGIFFKSDNILIWTNGNVWNGVLVFVLAAIAIVFGSLTIAQLAMLTDKPGGVISYAEEFTSVPAACAIGWFQTFAYMPTILVVVAWVAGVYTCILFGWPASLELQVALGVFYILAIFVCNMVSARLGGILQNSATIIKLIPLLGIGVLGMAFGNPAEAVTYQPQSVGVVGLISAIAPIAFSYDGWSIATSVCHEIRDAKKNLPRALVISPLLILLVYVLYFVGISALVGPEDVMAMGDEHVYHAARLLFGNNGAKVMLVFIIISVLGTVNGILLGMIRLPYSLAIRRMLPASNRWSKTSEKLGGIPVQSGFLCLAFALLWMLIHYITQKFGMLPNADVSEIFIVTNYLGYSVLYLSVIRLARQGRVKGVWNGYIIPVLALLGSLIILVGGMQNPLFFYYLGLSALIVLGALYYARKHQDSLL